MSAGAGTLALAHAEPGSPDHAGFIICAVLGCGVEEVLIREPDKMSLPPARAEPRAATGTSGLAVTPKRRDTRTLPPL